ncbi:MAG: SDR family NAD(P)-dependent oxidoreductase [Alphaproteobacteria bacterium]|jgi:nucleoside-diphosphate-sugar epimerase|nr:SDR family NAD(P)-dependent oxidoreductase [Alphaproteobacteria bacterium]MBU2041431.1 SDR family NAD(P)-dependent oxidoreductase [Alphaproteobacteria bacterium]MBU2126836.1 SDR family NAD(P)-dependent oxidoreductase [Alphaproteobacteria bacterium]MBU2208306.1 SDR family NAD(P)-dependent oxidoreductase [Alphaproteobacteria bacterium]MBU2292307.1 SDR family NAD(P)-dependent oxidoreductase [Alphaproteobacteria bacterium]
MSEVVAVPSLLVFGGGWLGRAVGREALRRGGRAILTSRDAARRTALIADGFEALDPDDATALAGAVGAASAIVVSAPPEADGCPGLKALSPALAGADVWPDWIGYVSSTAVYGDRAGGWALEDSELNAASLEGARRVRAERDWLDAGQGMGLTVQVFRLPALYGPGRSPLDRLRDGTARIVRKPGQVFNRVHVDDVVSGLFASMARPRPGAAYILCDDEPAPADVVMEGAARRLDLPLPPEVDWTDPSVSETMRRFYLDSKRLSNARAKAELGWRPKYPTWREGLEALIAETPG